MDIGASSAGIGAVRQPGCDTRNCTAANERGTPCPSISAAVVCELLTLELVQEAPELSNAVHTLCILIFDCPALWTTRYYELSE